MEHPGFSLSVALRYFVVPAVLVPLAVLWWVRTEPHARLRPTRPDRVAWALIVVFAAMYGLMATLAYLAYRTTIHDLGVYDQRLWVLAALRGFPSPGQIAATFGHFSPILILHVLIYELYPGALVLLWLQVAAVAIGGYPVYRMARRHLGPHVALVFVAGYLLYPSVVFTVLTDFHPDHLLIPLMLWAFDLLDRGDRWVLAGVFASMLLIKESMIPGVLAFGVYAAVVRRRDLRGLSPRGYLLAGVVLLAALALFVVVVVREYAGVFQAGSSGAESYGYLGSDVPSILRTVVLSPNVWLAELVQVPKLKFLFLLVAPLAFLPLAGPGALLVAAPGLLMSLLSQHPHRYQIWAQYTASIIPPLFAAAIVGGRRLASSGLLNRLSGAPLRRWVPLCVLGAAVYFNVAFSPSPLSTTFWLGTPDWLRWRYHWTAYRVTERDREIRRAIERYIPTDPRVRVSAQNTVNSSRLAHRHGFGAFHYEGDFTVIDLRRPLFVFDVIDPVFFAKRLEEVKGRSKILIEFDGFIIFGPSSPA